MAEDAEGPAEPSPNEAFYDAEIAPELARLAKLCEDRGMAFLADVEFNPGETGMTAALPKGHTFEMRMVLYAMQSHGNLDSLAFAVAKDCRMNDMPHSSIVLSNLGLECAVKDRK